MALAILCVVILAVYVGAKVRPAMLSFLFTFIVSYFAGVAVVGIDSQISINNGGMGLQFFFFGLVWWIPCGVISLSVGKSVSDNIKRGKGRGIG